MSWRSLANLAIDLPATALRLPQRAIVAVRIASAGGADEWWRVGGGPGTQVWWRGAGEAADG